MDDAGGVKAPPPAADREADGAPAGRRQRPRRDRPVRARLRRVLFSPIAFGILATNLVVMLLAVVGFMLTDEYRDGLVESKLQAARGEAQLLAQALANGSIPETAVRPSLDGDLATLFLYGLGRSVEGRTRIYGVPTRDFNAPADGVSPISRELADTRRIFEVVSEAALPPVGDEPFWRGVAYKAGAVFARIERALDGDLYRKAEAARLEDEVAEALTGRLSQQVRFNEDGELVASVSAPVRRVQTVHGVVTVELGGIEALLDRSRQAATPYLVIAFAANLAAALILTARIALPLRLLAISAERVRAGAAGSNRTRIPDFTRRRDEIGHLSGALRSMTSALFSRLEAIETFAADVAHELKNPLTSIRSAADTLPIAATDAARDKLLHVIRKDVERMDRLITDISNASRLDADLAREAREVVDIERLLTNVIDVYHATRKEGAPDVRFVSPGAPAPVFGFTTPLGQVFRNLIDNALSFSPDDGTVTVRIEDAPGVVRVAVEDEGPGVPEDLREKIFDRFYTERPKSAAKGDNSGLGLAICRQIVSAHGGAIRAEDAAPGARFVVEIPRAR